MAPSHPAVRRRDGPAPARRRTAPLEQLVLELPRETPRWSLSRLVQRSPHRPRILARLEFVRRFFPEMNGATIRVGLAQKRGVLGWGSLDPERPGLWVRPRITRYFTIAHEFTHLLQARGLPRALRQRRALEPWQATLLHEAARRALAARERGDRRYLSRFEREVTLALAARR